MPVSGRELATLDFGNLIGGPLNAIVEAQARSAITTANFIREVGFDADGNVINVDFSYTRKDDQGDDQAFTLTVPFITMLPIPYVTVESGTIEFNAKITSVTESHSEQNFDQVVEASASTKAWFVNASVHSKTSYQKKSSNSDREERTFDMHVLVQVKNQDMPAGTERLLTLLENVIEEKQMTGGTFVLTITAAAAKDDDTVTVEGDFAKVKEGATFKLAGTSYTITSIDEDELTLAPDLADDVTANTTITVKNPGKAPAAASSLAAKARRSPPSLPSSSTAPATVVQGLTITGNIGSHQVGDEMFIDNVKYKIDTIDQANNKLSLIRA